MSRRSGTYAPFAQVFTAAAEHPPRRRRGVMAWIGRTVGTLVTFVLAAALVGVAVAAVFVPPAAAPAIAVREAVLAWEALPTDLPTDLVLPQRTRILDRNGDVIASVYAQNRLYVPYQKLPQVLIDAVVAIEDARFFERSSAVDFRGTLRAFANNQAGGPRQGGSTLTQQYVKNLLLTAAATQQDADAAVAPTVDRKIREARYAVAVERTLSKEQILEGYLNMAYFGHGAYGVGAAAQRFFGTPVSDLTAAEAATLAGILKAPTYYNPIDHKADSRARRNLVLDAMVDTGALTTRERDTAAATKITLRPNEPKNGCSQSRYPLYCTTVLQTLADDPAFGATPEARQDLLYRGGLDITTALDPQVTDATQAAVTAALDPTNRVAAAAAVVQPGTGHVLALVSSRTWGTRPKKGESQLLLPVLPAYQPGSNFKPVTLAAALERGLDPDEAIDSPSPYIPGPTLNYPPGGFHNDDDRSKGPLTAYQATAQSVNTYYVRLIERVGVLPTADMAARLGMTSLPRTGPRAVTSRDAALTLGAYETSPLQMATVYASFASGGITCRPTTILTVTRDGQPLPTPDPSCHQAVDASIAATVTRILTGVFGRGGTANGLGLDRPAAGKTGTTNDSAATWFTGYTPDYVTSVWVGDPRGGQKYPLYDVVAYGRTLPKVYGRSIAAPIWRDTMTALHDGLPVRPFPEGTSPVTGAVTVPDVRGLTVNAAAAVLTDAGYRVKINKQTAAVDPLQPPGSVAAQSPGPGLQLPTGSAVTLTLTNGSDTRVIPPGSGPAPGSG